MNAVDNEFKKNLSEDSRRISQIMKTEISIKGGPIDHFGTGNLQTLQIPKIRELLLEFYDKNYSANLMSLCLVGNHSLDTLESIAKENFA